MQSRRREEHAAVSPPSKLRAQPRIEVGSDSYRSTRRDGSDRSPVLQRNLIPQKLDGLRRGADGDKGVDDFERRDYDWHSGSRRSSQVPSRSPPSEQVRKRPHYDDGGHRSYSPPLGLRPRFELSKTVEYNVDDKNLDAKYVYQHEHVNSRINREKELVESRSGGGQGILNQKMENENENRGSYRLFPDKDITSKYEETDGHLPSMSKSVAAGRYQNERLQHCDPLSSDKMSATEYHKGAEKPIFHARDVFYSTLSPPYAKDFATTSQLRDYGGSSVEMSRGDLLCSHHDGINLPTSYELSRSSGKLAEPVGYSGWQRSVIDPTRDSETGQRNMICHQRCTYSPTRAEHEEYFSSKLPATIQNQRGHQSDDLHRRIAPHGRINYEQALMDYDNRELSRPFIMHPDFDRTGKGEDIHIHGNHNHNCGTIHNHPALQKPKYMDYPDMSRTSIASKQAEEYLGPGYDHLEIGRRMPQEYEVSYLGASEADHLSILRSEYGSQRDGGLGHQQERFQGSPCCKHNLEAHRHAVRVQDMKQDLRMCDHSDRLFRRNNVNEEIDVHDLRTIKLSKRGAPEEFQDLYESEEWLEDEDMNILYSSGDVGFDHKVYRKDKRKYNRLGNEEDFPSDDWILSQDSPGYVQQRSSQFHKFSGQNVKSHLRSNSSSWYKSQHSSKRNAIYKQPKVWKKYHVYDENMPTSNDEPSEDWPTAIESEPTEGSEEFKQMVHEAFLVYSKKLNLVSSVQRRYKEQGKAGSLYCIVCGRSSSKEFMDTQRLVTHAFMSHKAGLRAKHLALHKAICVLLGWDTVVPQDTVTWVPQVLPYAEALAQKEDLILWPPVVIIHNISMSDDNPQKWKVVSIETTETFLRGNGFVRGRIKLCLGKPADQSIILVKFLGTFNGLGDAERLHKYLSYNNRGRIEYERFKSKGTKNLNIVETEVPEENVEHILYGYMGIAEDLDKLDFNAKKRILVKSRKEIDDLDNAPVKPNES